MTDKQPEALLRADELEAIGAESSLARAMAAHTIRLLYKEKAHLHEENELLKARLAQLEPEHWSDCAVYNEPAYPKGLCNCGGFPVAWADLKGIRLEFDIEDCFSFIKKENYVPLYTAPPKKEWVGLTEAEKLDILDAELTTQNTEHFALVQAIEAKLKEKNT